MLRLQGEQYMLFGALLLACLLAFSFKITELAVKLINPSHTKFSIYYWGIIVLGACFVLKDNYVFHVPENIMSVLPLFLFILVANCIISNASGYAPIGTFDRINFILVFPILEEIAFRGLVLPVLARHTALEQGFQVFYIYSASFAVILTAFLFAVSHLQYYRLDKQSIRFMIFAFFGGIFFGVIAQATESVVLTIPLHTAFNGSAAFYAKWKQLGRP